MPTQKQITKLTDEEKKEITHSVSLAVESYVNKRYFYNSHISGSRLFERISSENNTVSEALRALRNRPKGVMGNLIGATIFHRDPKLLSLLKPQLDEPMQCIVDGIVEGLKKVESPVELRCGGTEQGHAPVVA